jgi:hypothetical protein
MPLPVPNKAGGERIAPAAMCLSDRAAAALTNQSQARRRDPIDHFIKETASECG